MLKTNELLIPMHHARGLVYIAEAQGAPREALLRETGLSEEALSNPELRVQIPMLAQLVESALRLTGNPALGLDFGRHMHLANLGMLGLAVVNSPDPRAALEISLKYFRTVVPMWELGLELNLGVGRFTAHERAPLGALRPFACESLLTSLTGMARTIAGVELPLIEVRLPYPEPEHAARYADVSKAKVVFDAPLFEVQFDARALGRPLPAPDSLTMRIAERQCASLMANSGGRENLVGQVRQLLGRRPGDYLDLVALAGALRTSARSLRRNLQRTGTSYQSLLDEVRLDHANEYLVGSDLTMESISEHLGFSDVRSFRRAFKRWTGLTPAEFRRSHRQAQPQRETTPPPPHTTLAATA